MESALGILRFLRKACPNSDVSLWTDSEEALHIAPGYLRNHIYDIRNIKIPEELSVLIHFPLTLAKLPKKLNRHVRVLKVHDFAAPMLLGVAPKPQIDLIQGIKEHEAGLMFDEELRRFALSSAASDPCQRFERLQYIENHSLRDALLKRRSTKHYARNHTLYLGEVGSVQAATRFISLICIKEKNDQNAYIDIILPKTNLLEDTKGLTDALRLSSPYFVNLGIGNISTLSIHPDKGLIREQISTINTKNKSKKTLRIIIPYSLPSSDLTELTKASEPFTYVNGRSAFLRAISARKIISLEWDNATESLFTDLNQRWKTLFDGDQLFELFATQIHHFGDSEKYAALSDTLNHRMIGKKFRSFSDWLYEHHQFEPNLTSAPQRIIKA